MSDTTLVKNEGDGAAHGDPHTQLMRRDNRPRHIQTKPAEETSSGLGLSVMSLGPGRSGYFLVRCLGWHKR